MLFVYILLILLAQLTHSSTSPFSSVALKARSKANEIKFDDALEAVRTSKTLNSTEKIQIIHDLYERLYSNLRKNDLARQRARERDQRLQEKLERQKQQEKVQQQEQEMQIYQKYLASRTGSSVLKDFYVQRY